MNLALLVKQVAIDLNDPQHIVWPASSIAVYLSEGARAYNQATQNTTGGPAAIYAVDCQGHIDTDCDEIAKVNGQCTESGRIIAELTLVDSEDESLRWPGEPQCVPNAKNFKLREYSMSPDGTGVTFYPNPPLGAKVWVSVECAPSLDSVLSGMDSASPASAGGSISDKAVPAAIQWALWRCLSIDGDNNQTVFAVAQDHRTAFNEQIKLAVAARREKLLERYFGVGILAGLRKGR
jgi:hypothetical protein